MRICSVCKRTLDQDEGLCPCQRMNDEARKKFDEMFSEALRQNRLSHAKFTVKQLAEAVWQALVCGDFVRYVNVDNDAQQVVYIPFREHERLQARIRELEAEIEILRDYDDTPD